MSAKVQSSSSTPAQATNPQADVAQAMKDVCTQLREFSSAASFNSVLKVFDEIDALRKRLELNDDELAKVKEETNEKEKKKDIAIHEMFEANRMERIKRDEILQRVQLLEASVQEKETVITQQNETLGDLKSQLQKRQLSYDAEKANVTRAQSDIDTLERSQTEKDAAIEKMKTAGSKLKKALSAKEEKVKELETKSRSLTESVQVMQAHLGKLEGLTAGYHMGDEEFILNEFSALWGYATAEIYTKLKEDLPNQALENLQAWRNFRKHSDQALRHRVPLPRTNSNAAKQMRTIVILAILAREIDTNLFQPTYILPEDSQIRQVLANLAANDNEKESFCRSLLLSIDPDSQAKSRDSRIQTVIRNTSTCLFDLLPETKYDELRLALKRIVQKAVDVWTPIQNTKRRYEPDFDPLQWEDDESVPFAFPDDGEVESQAINGVVDDNLLTVFPRISQVDGNGRSPCTFAVQVRRSQRPYLAAEQELIQEPSSPTIGRMSSARSRRKSITPGSPNQPKGNFLGKSVSSKA